MFNGSCYPNGSYINYIYFTPGISEYISHLQCVLLNSTLSGGEWINPNGQPVNCNTNNVNDPIRCVVSSNPANITVYNLVDKYLMNLIEMIITIHLSVVYLVIVLILLPTSSLFIYSVSYISLY